MRAAPFHPGQKMSTTFAISVDDTSLHFDVSKLTPKQKKDDEESRDLMGFLQVCVIGLGKPADYVAMYTEFGEAPWPRRLERYTDFFKRMGLAPVPAEHRPLFAKENFYANVAKAVPDTDSVTLYMTSGTNGVLHDNPEAYRISQNVNSKLHFARNAPGFGIPVPHTIVVTKGELDSDEVRAFVDMHGGKLMAKTLGLAGARNVVSVDSLDEIKAFVDEYDDDMEVLLQQRLDLSKWTEMTADLFVDENQIYVSNVRQIMFADGIWVGNLIGPDVELRPEHEKELLKIGEYARAQGYCEPEGVNCGVDYFISDDGDFIVTEINARWTGGLFPAEMIRRVGATEETCVAFVDMVVADKFDTYLDFVDRHLYKESKGPFSMIPLGCSPIPQMLPNGPNFLSWQIVAGDFEAFKQARRDELGDGALMRAESISLKL